MNYTISNMLSDHIPEDWTILTPSLDLSEKVITAISVQDLPMEGMLRPGELVLVNISANDSEDTVRRIIEEAGAGGASGVLLAFETDLPISEESIKRAEHLGLPLIRVSWKQRFADIQAEVNRAIWDIRTGPYQALQNSLFQDYFRGCPLEDAVLSIATVFSAEAAITDENGAILASTEEFQETAVTLPIEINQEHLGDLLLGNSDAIPEDAKSIVLPYISYPLTLWFNKMRIERITETKLTSDFAMSLARGPVTAAVIRDARYLGFSLNQDYRAVTLRIDRDAPDEPGAVLQHSPDITSSVVQEGDHLQLSVIAGDDLEHYVAFIQDTSTGSDLLLEKLLDRWEARIQELVPGARCQMGISQPFPGETGLSEAYQQALVAMGFCSPGKSARIYYENARKLRILAAIAGQADIREEASKVLGRLIAYDQNGGSMELLRTLDAFFEHNYNVSETARSLFIRRQSLHGRLQKIEEMTGFSLKDHEDLYVLESYLHLSRNFSIRQNDMSGESQV